MLLQELFRFIAVKVEYDDLDANRRLAPAGLVERALNVLLLNPFFCKHLMRAVGKPGQVLSHVPDEDNGSHEVRVRAYAQRYRETFGEELPGSLPSGEHLWPTCFGHAGRREPESEPEAFAPFVDPHHDKSQRELPSQIPSIIYVKTLARKTIVLELANLCTATPLDLAAMIEATEGIPCDHQKLSFQGKTLFLGKDLRNGHGSGQWEDKLVPLQKHGLSHESTIVLMKRAGC